MGGKDSIGFQGKTPSETRSILLLFFGRDGSEGFQRILSEDGTDSIRDATDSLSFSFPFFKIVVNCMLA
jgi:hypothetical protein